MRFKTGMRINDKRLPIIIRSERARRGHTLRQAAVEMESCAEAVRNWERGVVTPVKEKLLRIAAYLNLPQTTVTKYWVQDRKFRGGAA